MTLIISPDQHRYYGVGGKYIYREEDNPRVVGAAYKEFRGILALRKPTRVVVMMGLPGSGKTTWAQKNGTSEVFFDATNTTRSRREPLLSLIEAQGHCPELVFCDETVRTCVTRNEERELSRGVPEDVLHRIHDKLEPPSPEEGWLRVRVVTQGKVVRGLVSSKYMEKREAGGRSDSTSVVHEFREFHEGRVAEGTALSAEEYYSALLSEMAEFWEARGTPQGKREYGDMLANAILLGIAEGYEDPFALATESKEKVVSRLKYISDRMPSGLPALDHDRVYNELWEQAKSVEGELS